MADMEQEKKIYFLSDAHLRMDESDSEKEKKLLAILDEVKYKGSHLYILGDLFDFWFEYKYAIPATYLKILSKLLELTKSGVNICYLFGNHDFWMKNYLKREIQIELIPDFLEVNHFNRKIFLTHGDGLRKDDTGYKILKKILRNKFCIWLYSKLPVDFAYRLAIGTSRVTRKHTDSRDNKDSKDYIGFAKSKIENGCDAVVLGHLHKPEIVDLGKGIYVNCGDLFENYSYVTLDKNGFELRRA
jgi:UDP-2,3-diacylglucosamine hydrolase